MMTCNRTALGGNNTKGLVRWWQNSTWHGVEKTNLSKVGNAVQRSYCSSALHQCFRNANHWRFLFCICQPSTSLFHAPSIMHASSHGALQSCCPSYFIKEKDTEAKHEDKYHSMTHSGQRKLLPKTCSSTFSFPCICALGTKYYANYVVLSP